MREYDPQTYGYYQYDKGLKAQGQQIVQGLTSQLNNYNQLISSSDPNAILADFNNKMQNIESLEQNYLDQSFQFGQQRGNELAGQLNSGDYLGAFTNAINTIGTMSEMKRAEEQLADQKAQLAEQRRQKMSQVYWKAIEFNDRMIEEYMKRAAFAEDLPTEQYNLAFVEHLQCYSQQMDRRWSSTSTSWLTNNCSKPQEPNVKVIENKFIAKDVQIKKVAERKLKLYNEKENSAFLDAAIAFAAKATELNPSGENYYYLSELYRRKSTLLAYATILTSREINPSYFDDSRTQVLNEIKEEATEEVAVAIKDNDTEYLSAFLAAGLDRSIKIDGKTLLSEAIQLDQPDALQLIVNQYIDGLSQDKINAKVQQVIMLCAIQNAPACLERFIGLGVPIDFTLKGYTPIELTAKSYAPDAYRVLIANSQQKSQQSKYANHPFNVLIAGIDDPSTAAAQLETQTQDVVAAITLRLLDLAPRNKNYYQVIGQSSKAQAYISRNPHLKSEVIERFEEEIIIPSPFSNAHYIWKTGLIDENSMLEIKYSGERDPINNSAINAFHFTCWWEMKDDSAKLMRGIRSDRDVDFSDWSMNDIRSVEYMHQRLQKMSLTGEHPAVLAFIFYNYELFSEIDKSVDLLKVKTKSGITLADLMVDSETVPLSKTPQFQSNDFQLLSNESNRELFHKQLLQILKYSNLTKDTRRHELTEIQKMILERLSHEYYGPRRSYPLDVQFDKNLQMGNEVIHLLEINGLSLDSQFSNSGGTLLHWAVDNLREKTDYGYLLDKSLIDVVLSLGVNPNIEDSNGKNAFDYIESKKKELKETELPSRVYLHPKNQGASQKDVANAYGYIKYMLGGLK